MDNVEFSLQGIIEFINPTKNVSKQEGKDFLVASFGLDTSFLIQGQRIEQCAAFQCVQDKTKDLEGLNIGDEIKVFFTVKGSMSEKDELEATPKNPKKLIAFNNLTAYRIEVLKKVKSSESPSSTEEVKEEKDDLPFGD